MTWRAISSRPYRKVTVDGMVSTFAGDGTAGFQDGPGATARFNALTGVAVDARGNVFVSDCGNHRVRQITPDSVVSTLAGSGQAGFGDGQGTDAHFYDPMGIAVDSQGDIFVADFQNHRIRRVSPQGEVTTIAGSGAAVSFADAPTGPGTQEAFFRYPSGIAVDREGNVFVSDNGNRSIRKMTLGGPVTTLAGGGGGGSDGF